MPSSPSCVQAPRLTHLGYPSDLISPLLGTITGPIQGFTGEGVRAFCKACRQRHAPCTLLLWLIIGASYSSLFCNALKITYSLPELTLLLLFCLQGSEKLELGLPLEAGAAPLLWDLQGSDCQLELGLPLEAGTAP